MSCKRCALRSIPRSRVSRTRGQSAFARAISGPSTYEAQLARSRAFGQLRPTLLLLRYRAGDYNCQHQDLYGPIHFPLQAAVMLSAQGSFTGGALTLVESRPRLQSRAEAGPIRQGRPP